MMFYNHEFITSKKAGLRIVWFASTLGLQSRRLTKRDVANVDVVKTCKIVAHPEEPLALRTSGQLLYGAVRIYTKQAEYWMMDVQTHHSAVRKLMNIGKGSIKQIGGVVIVGQDTSTIDMPGRGRFNQDAVTLPSRFDLFASHTNIDFQWGTNEVVGDSDVFMASLASVYSGSQRSPAPSVEYGMMGMRSSSQGRGKYTLDPSEVRRMAATSSPEADLAPFSLDALLPEIHGEGGVDLGLDTTMEGGLAPMNDMNDLGFDMLPDWGLGDGQAGDNDYQGPPSPNRRRERSGSAEFLPVAARPAKRTRFALADSSTEISNEVVLHWRDNYASYMADLRKKEIERQMLRKGALEGLRLPFAPSIDISLAGPLVKLWEDSIEANKLTIASHLADVDDPGVGRNEANIDAGAAVMPWQDDFDMPQWEDPGLPIGGVGTSSYGSEVARGSQGSSSQKNTLLPWNLPLDRMQAGETTVGGDTTSLHSARSFLVETPTGLRRQSNRQSSIGGEMAVEEDLLAVSTRPFLPQGTQEITDTQVANFFTYVNRMRSQVPSDQPLFFSDLAPIADSTRFVAASAFYNTLALATVNQLKVKQGTSYGDIEIEIISA